MRTLPPLTAVALALFALSGTARAASVIVQLPEDAAIHVYDRNRPDAPRIDCPGVCTYSIPGDFLDLFELKVDVVPDPRTGDPPWDLVAMNGCGGTSTLPADNAICFLPAQSSITLSFQLQYRPVVAVKVGGAVGGPLSFLTISGGPGADNSPIVGFACNAMAPTVPACAKHQQHGASIALSAGTSLQATLDSVSPPCGSGNCKFPIEEDTCVGYLYRNGAPLLFPTVEISGPECPTGPGIGGGGGGGPPPELDPIKQLALQQMRRELAQALAPCLTAGTAVSLFALGTPGVLAGRLVFAPAAGICARIVQHLVDLQKVYDDPPAPSYTKVAPITSTGSPSLDLSPCKELTGPPRRLCRKLGSAAQRHVAKLFHVGDVITSLRTAIERASAASQANDQKAIKRQVTAAGKRSTQLAAAFAARAKAGAKVAAILRDAGTTGSLDEAQFTEAASIVLDDLAAVGLPASAAQAVLGPALTPRTIDLVDLLGQP